MASETEIARLAAVRIGSSARITSLNDNTALARTLKAVWDVERKATLRDGAWNFATRTVELGAVDPATLEGAAVPHPWANAYLLPGECLRFLAVLDDYGKDKFERQSDAVGELVLCDVEAPLPVRIVVDRPVERFDAAASAAFALRLAWRCGRKIAGSAFDLDTCWAEYRQAISGAKTVDAREGPPIEPEESDWVKARKTGRW